MGYNWRKAKKGAVPIVKAFFRDVVVTVVVTVVIFILIQTTLQVSVIHGYCMEPNLHEGQRLVVNKAAYFFGQPEQGDIIVFHPPTNPEGVPYIKRIIGVAGETIEVKDGEVYVDGQTLDEPYIKEPPAYTLHEEEIPKDSYFVLGDNRNNSNDSHNGWTVPRQNIIAKAWLSIWPPQYWGLAPNHSSDKQ